MSKKRKPYSIEIKFSIIQDVEANVPYKDITVKYGVSSKSTISTIIKQKSDNQLNDQDIKIINSKETKTA